MRSTATMRSVALLGLTALVLSACSGGFGGASPSAAPSEAASVAPSVEASASASAAAEPVTLTYLVDDTEATQARAAGAHRRLHGAPPEGHLRDRDAPRRHGRRQHRQDPTRPPAR